MLGLAPSPPGVSISIQDQCQSAVFSPFGASEKREKSHLLTAELGEMSLQVDVSSRVPFLQGHTSLMQGQLPSISSIY